MLLMGEYVFSLKEEEKTHIGLPNFKLPQVLNICYDLTVKYHF